jgi:hypothetical protein
MGAMDTVLLYCTPGLPGSPRQGCDLGRIRKGVGEVTASARKKAKGDRHEHAVSEAARRVDRDTRALKPCNAWFASGGRSGGGDCTIAWFALTSDWRVLKTAVQWP